jgi:hypothetical protein
MNTCPICLETGGTEHAPCGYESDLIMFHAHCLDKVSDAGCTRCPHCNVSTPAVGLRRVRRVVDAWLNTPGLWRQREVFVTLQQGLMRGECEEKTTCEAVGHVVDAMQKKNSKVIFVVEKRSTRKFVMSGASDTTNVTLQRSAVLNKGGLASCCDGYVLSASRIRKRR